MFCVSSLMSIKLVNNIIIINNSFVKLQLMKFSSPAVYKLNS